MATEVAISSVRGGTQVVAAGISTSAEASEGGAEISIHFNESLPMIGTSMPANVDLLPIFSY